MSEILQITAHTLARKMAIFRRILIIKKPAEAGFINQL
ncbi:hypothetical protein ymoll0001_8700 [Yersinia mollaretii ATCC 43969]|uniref:Uncharacterized protein n=1 Tax=Yersinia mollaretii (strain ATCC 43969 / DSM 18520 / CIP 103324 / CNY 7263 / WAIP 204) TaxID=349967 RepID=A0ABP2EHN7_YERMW|nr:hypothetical protein ymoll0001_8700 [Yersinia mollaretii ATCC 43969]